MTTTAADTEARVRESVEAFNRADWATVREMADPGMVYEETGSGRRIEGIDAVLDTLRAWRTGVPDVRGEITRMVVDGDETVVEIVWRGTQTGPLVTPGGTIPPTGRPRRDAVGPVAAAGGRAAGPRAPPHRPPRDADPARPEDAIAALVHACHLLREHRGDSHLAVCAVACLDPVETNLLTGMFCGFRPLAYAATRVWPEEALVAGMDRLRGRGLVDGETLTAEGLRLRTDLEEQTDRMQQSVVDAIGPDLDVHVKQLDAWSNALVAAGNAPPDPAKRAAG